MLELVIADAIRRGKALLKFISRMKQVKPAVNIPQLKLGASLMLHAISLHEPCGLPHKTPDRSLVFYAAQ